jgi:glutathione S-transferase
VSTSYTLYGWHLSYFTGKALCYLRYKQAPFEHKAVDMFTLMRRIKRKTGAAVMPVMVTPEGEWINDTSRIIDHVEARIADRSVHPATPVQRFASYLMEAWGDEWWIPMAMQLDLSENYACLKGGRPGPAPTCQASAKASSRDVATKLRGMLHSVGVRPGSWRDGCLDADMLDRWTHFAQHRFLFGDRPTQATSACR